MNPSPKPLDLALFKGQDIVSAIISTGLELGVGASDWTHVGVFVDSTVLPLPQLQHGRLYVLESTSSNDENPDVVSGKKDFGVQIRDFETTLRLYEGHVGFAALSNAGVVDMERAKEFLIKLWEKEKDLPYSANLLNLVGALFSCCRGQRKLVNSVVPAGDMNHSKFCSQLAAEIYLAVGVFEGVDPTNVVPMDLLGFDKDENGVKKGVFQNVVQLK